MLRSCFVTTLVLIIYGLVNHTLCLPFPSISKYPTLYTMTGSNITAGAIAHPDPDITAKLRNLQSRVQVWVKPTDRILTDADAYEYDCYRAERKSDGISFHWGVTLTIFAALTGAATYYACLLLVSDRINGYLADDSDGLSGGLVLGELISVMAFHLGVFPTFALFLGNQKVKRITMLVMGYCLLGLGLAAFWWWAVFGGPTATEKSMGLMCMRMRPFGVGMVGGVSFSDGDNP
ncbi:hypothetical protein ABW21_db0208444 [Orbilia brochopaga]|nr:hypothetical protein ABW21_db0208444 [Drechslerella brochopaga]